MEAESPKSENPSPTGVRRLAGRMRAGLGTASGKLSRRTRIAILVGALMVGANLALVLTWANVKSKDETETKRDDLPAALEAPDRSDHMQARRLARHPHEQRGDKTAESGGPSLVLGTRPVSGPHS